jgi:hypothetical protein
MGKFPPSWEAAVPDAKEGLKSPPFFAHHETELPTTKNELFGISEQLKGELYADKTGEQKTLSRKLERNQSGYTQARR